MITLTQLLLAAASFAATAHAGQIRKGVLREPYLVHPLEVAALVSRATEDRDPVLIAAAILHDTVEDTSTTLDEIASVFGCDIRNYVAEVTDDKSLPKAERKAIQIATLSGRSEGARMIRLADKISNLRSLAKDPPQHWSREAARDYIRFCRRVGAVARSVSRSLGTELDRAAVQAGARFGLEKTECPPTLM